MIEEAKEISKLLRSSGEGCNCNAWNSGECACDATWGENYTKDAADTIDALVAEVVALKEPVQEPMGLLMPPTSAPTNRPKVIDMSRLPAMDGQEAYKMAKALSDLLSTAPVPDSDCLGCKQLEAQLKTTRAVLHKTSAELDEVKSTEPKQEQANEIVSIEGMPVGMGNEPEQAEPEGWDDCRSEKLCRRWCGNSACISHPEPNRNTELLKQALEALESFKLPEDSILAAQAGNLILRVPMGTVNLQAAAYTAIKQHLGEA